MDLMDDLENDGQERCNDQLSGGDCYLGSGTAYGHGSVRQTGSCCLVDVTVTRHGTDTQTSQDLLQTQHDLKPTLRLREEEEGLLYLLILCFK